MKSSRSIAAVVPLALVGVLAYAVHVSHLASAAALASVGEEEIPGLFVPDAPLMRKLALGQHTALSDLHWLQLIQYVGTPEADAAGWPQLFDIGNLVVDLDPEHGYAYEIVGILLSTKKRIDQSTEMFEKGMRHVPERWQLPFFAGFNYFFERADYQRGGELLASASQLPGVPAYVPLLATRLLNTAGEADTALAFVEAALREAGDNEGARRTLEERRDALLIEQQLQTLEQALSLYAARTGTRARRLEDLVGTVLVAIPTAPSGTPFSFDAETGAVSHPDMRERLLYRPPDQLPTVRAVDQEPAQ